MCSSAGNFEDSCMLAGFQQARLYIYSITHHENGQLLGTIFSLMGSFNKQHHLSSFSNCPIGSTVPPATLRATFVKVH